MMTCSEVRWQLSQFLKGETGPTQDELIRDHLDDCSDCALRLVSSGRVDQIPQQADIPWNTDLTQRVLSYYPVSPAGMVMVRHLSWVFIVSAAFAVGVFVFVRKMLEATPARSFDRLSESGTERLDAVAVQLAANPFLNYVALAVLATLICVALIALVDRPTRNDNAAIRSSR